MRITEKQYAQSLLESVNDKKKEEIKQIIERFIELLVSNNDVSRADKIIREFEKMWNKELRIVETEVKSASELTLNLTKELKEYIKGAAKAEKVEITHKVDKELLGGVVLKYGDKVMDASLKTRLKALEEEMKK